jgi:plastocyanin
MSRTYGLTTLGFLAGCAGAYGTSAPVVSGLPATAATVNATPDINFSPTPASIVPGGTITFAFGTIAHNVYFDSIAGAPADIPGNNAGTSVSRTFETAGTYTYNCHIHPGMNGTIVVGAMRTPPAEGTGP